MRLKGIEGYFNPCEPKRKTVIDSGGDNDEDTCGKKHSGGK